MHEIPARLALIVALIAPVALSACSRTPHAAAKVGPERVEPAAALPSSLRRPTVPRPTPTPACPPASFTRRAESHSSSSPRANSAWVRARPLTTA
ncbi:MAG: hypothetical protein IPJ07_24155 [Acidobacteria bacterium]|nr:hypothetical protein [Acidobacteriota bacterium]